MQLSGIQHFVFCRRQWALITIEQEWRDNALTAEGNILHDQVDDPYYTESRNGVITARAVPVASYKLGLTGICDVVLFFPSDSGNHLPNRNGLFQPTPIEYKRGRPKDDDCDRAQLCAQAICLEEMLCVEIKKGFIFYGQTRRRTPVMFDKELRQLVADISREMHGYFSRGYTPRVKISKACKSCSLKDICLPELQSKSIPASAYIQQEIESM